MNLITARSQKLFFLLAFAFALLAAAGAYADELPAPALGATPPEATQETLFPPEEKPAVPSATAATPAATPIPEAAPEAIAEAPLPAPTVEASPAPALPPPPAPTPTPVKNSYADFADEEENRSLAMHEGGRWQLGFSYVAKIFPDYDYDPDPNTSVGIDQWGIQGGLAFYPIISMGRFGFALNAGWNRRTTQDLIFTGLSPSFITYGVSARYEFKYTLGQTFVPFATGGYDKVSIHYSVRNQDIRDRFNSVNYGGGLALNLNSLEPNTASKSLNSTGIKKFYLEYTYLYRKHSSVTRTGAAHMAGLRFEF